MSTRPVALTSLVVFWCMLFTATHIPGSVLQEFPFSAYDLIVHFVGYFILTVLYMLACPHREKSIRQSTCRIFTILAVYAIFDELLQGPIPGRFVSLADIGANVGGVILALVTVEGYRWLSRGRRSSKDVAH